MEPLTTPVATSPPPAATAPASPPPPASPPTVPASGPGVSGTVPGSGTTNPTPAAPQTAPATAPAPAVPGFGAAASPASQALIPTAPQVDFATQFQQQFGMGLDQAKLLLTMGYQQYQRNTQQPVSPPAPAATPATPKNPFGIPQFDHRLLQFVGKDNQGNLVAMPGAPPDAVLRVQEYQDSFRDAQRKFYENPMEALGPLIQQEAKKVAETLYQQQFQQHQTAGFAEQVVKENEGWLFERNQQGGVQMVFDPANGREVGVLSPLGRFYNQKLQEARQSGIENPQARHNYAFALVQNVIYQHRLQQAGAPAAGQQAGQQFLQTQVNNPPATAPAPAVIPPQNPSTSLRDVMRQSFQQNGLTDDAVSNQINRRAG